MRVVFIGCVAFSYDALSCLLKIAGVEVVGVVTRYESAINADFCSLIDIAQKEKIPYFSVNGNEQNEMHKWILELKPDIIYCFGWSYLLKKEILVSAPMGVMGYHPAALPKNRGRHPIIWALALGLDRTASTFFFMNEGADSGDIISQREIIIDCKDNALTLYKKITETALKQIPEFTKQLMTGEYSRLPQDHSKANYWRKRNKSDGVIDWRMSDSSIYNLVRALSRPYVGAHCIYNEKEIKIWNVELTNLKDKFTNIEPGKIIKIDNTIIYIKCGNGVIKIVEHEFDELPREGCYL